MSKRSKRRPERQARIDEYKKHKKLRKLVLTGDDPALHTVCEPIAPTSHKALEVAYKLGQVCEAFENGVGLAAPQIGETVRVVYVWANRFRQKDSKGFAMINPEIIERSTAIDIKIEGCLSYPGKTVAVDRAREITVKWYDVNGEAHIDSFEGWEARVIQHELDHLDGVCRVGDAKDDDPALIETQEPAPRRSPMVAAAALAALAVGGFSVGR